HLAAASYVYLLSLHDALPIFGGKHLGPLRYVARSCHRFSGQSLRPPTSDCLGRLGCGAWSVVGPPYPRCSHLRPGHESCATDLQDRKSTRLNSSHVSTSYAVF